MRVSEKLRETFLERTAHALRIPDEMSNAEGGKVFARIPRGQSGNAAIAFVLPDTFSNSQSVRIGDLDRGNGPARVAETKRKQTNGEDERGQLLLG